MGRGAETSGAPAPGPPAFAQVPESGHLRGKNTQMARIWHEYTHISEIRHHFTQMPGGTPYARAARRSMSSTVPTA